MLFLYRYGWKNFLLWTGVLSLDFIGDYFNDVLWDRPFYWMEEIPFVTSWYTWFLLTPIVTRIASKWKYATMPLFNFVSIHAAIYLAVNVVQVFLSTMHIQFIAKTLMDVHPFQNILYKTAISGSFYNLLVYCMIVLVVNSIHYYNELRREQTRSIELKKKMAETRLEFLTAQLQPHFLFNTHHSIITLMKLGESAKAVMMMERLSELMRSNLREQTKQEQPLSKELHILGLYIDIQKIRFADRLNIIIEIGDEVKEALVPTMILQPLVENSIKFTVEKAPKASTIRITASGEKSRLFISIKDEGLAGEGAKGFGIGLRNTRERLETLYGGNYSFSISGSDKSDGSEVRLEIPLHYE